MKIGGVVVSKCEEILVLPRSDGDDIPFRAKAVAINDEFNKLVPEPVAPMVLKKGGKAPDYTDKDYLLACGHRDAQRFAFMCIKSLEPSDIEWEKVDLKSPGTWTGWDKELTEAGLSEVEVQRVVGLVMVANSLDENKIEQARKDFLLGQGAQPGESSGLQTEPPNS
jgi:hypothetical protein